MMPTERRTAVFPLDPSWRGTLAWLVIAAAVGFLVPYVAVDRVALPRELYVTLYVAAAATLCVAHAWASHWSARELIGDPLRGLVGAVAAGAFMIAFVLRSPASPAPSPRVLAWAVAWLGVVYATADAWLLTVLPVLVVRRLAAAGPASGGSSASAVFLAGLAASLAVAFVYHLGFPEFRGSRMLGALIGNSVFTIAYLATRSVIAPVGGHIVLHVASLVHGMQAAGPVPPHY